MLRTLARSFSSTAKRADLARFSAIGRIGTDLETRKSANDVEYLRYPLAVQTSKDKTSWFNLVVFDPQIINFMTSYLKKGSTVYVEADAAMDLRTNDDGSRSSSLQLVQHVVSPINSGKRTDEPKE